MFRREANDDISIQQTYTEQHYSEFSINVSDFNWILDWGNWKRQRSGDGKMHSGSCNWQEFQCDLVWTMGSVSRNETQEVVEMISTKMIQMSS